MHDLNAALQGQETVTAAVAGLESGARALRRSVDTVQGRTGEMVALARRLREAGDPAGAALDGFVDRVRRLDGDLRGVIRGISGLARVQSRSTGIVDGALRRLRDDSDRLLLVPAETVFGGYGRMVREIAREAGLAVEVRLHGLDLQVDRGLLQALKDPVLHALRNTISHGAETAQARRQAGKPEALNVTLSVASKGSQLLVTIRDDGRGPTSPASSRPAGARGWCRRGPTQPPNRSSTSSSRRASPRRPPSTGSPGAAWACRWWRRPPGRCAAGRPCGRPSPTAPRSPSRCRSPRRASRCCSSRRR